MAAILRNPLIPSQFFAIALILSLSIRLFPCCYSIDEQGRALLTWKSNLTSSTDALSTWNPEDPTPCSWFGVVCNSHGYVEEITLASLDLRGTLPSNFQALKFLRTLVISETNITGRIPKEFGDYNELRVLDLSQNNLLGEIPEEICRLGKLEDLSLQSNGFEGTIPLTIGNLSNLVYLRLADNEISGEIPKSIGMLQKLNLFRAGGNKLLEGKLPMEIGNCSSLVMLGLAETGIFGALPSSIGMLKNIQNIVIYKAQLFNTIPEEIGNCSELQTLILYQNSISGRIPRGIGKLKKLQTLFLWLNLLEESIPEEIGDCEELVILDVSENLLNGTIPKSIGRLPKLQEFQLSLNQITGSIPPEMFNCSTLVHVEVDNNKLSGEIPVSVGNLKNLHLFFAWENKLTGSIPSTLSDCPDLQAIDFSYNHLTGSIPKEIFGLKNLTKLLLIRNNLSGIIPPEIGHSRTLSRFRLAKNRFGGTIPSEMGHLKSLDFLDLAENHFVGEIPQSLSNCDVLQFIDLSSNEFTGTLPIELPMSLQFLNISNNRLEGQVNPGIGALTELTKLDLRNNQLSGQIPAEIVSCQKLQFLDLSNNFFSGELPKQLGIISSLDIALNLSWNRFSGEIPSEFSGLVRLSILDLSHNNLSGDLSLLVELENLVTLNISYNHFSGELPDTPFFQKLSKSAIAGNKDLYVSGEQVIPEGKFESRNVSKEAIKIVLPILISISAVLFFLAIYLLIRTQMANFMLLIDGDKWEITLFQKLDISIDYIIKNLTESNVIGAGSSGAVYRITTPKGKTVAVKKMWSTDESGGFNSEIRTLGLIRHKNIIRLLGWGSHRNLKLLFYDYLPNGSLSSFIHDNGKGGAEWEARYDILLGVAHALAYLHHDCTPPIVHGDVKTLNVLLGHDFEPYLADFGLASNVSTNNSNDASKKPILRQLAGSFGYMAPEHGSILTVSEKSDVYSFGIVVMEVLTGRHPLDPTLPGEGNLAQWVRDHLATKKNPADILDSKLRERTEPTMREILQTLDVALICVSVKSDDRPPMKSIVAMLEEIRSVEVGKAATDDPKSEKPVVIQSTLQRKFSSQGSLYCKSPL
ncbi:LRR receptor-like serine/threonine-protein kinase, partial [Cucurbita argyrosperma subsp. argyrosperma]